MNHLFWKAALTAILVLPLCESSQIACGALLVSSRGTNSVLQFDSDSGTLLRTFAAGNGLLGPTGLAYGPDGNLYVASHFGNEVLRFHGQTGDFLGSVATVERPTGLAFNPGGNLFVGSLSAAPSVVELDVSGPSAAVIDTYSAGLVSPQSLPFGLAFGPNGELLVGTDAGGVKVLNSDTGTFETLVSRPDDQTFAYGIAVDGSSLLVTDFNNVRNDGNISDNYSYGRVLEFDAISGDSQGILFDTFPNTFELMRASGILADGNGNVYVAGFNSNNVVKLNRANGELDMSFITPGSGGLLNPTFMVIQPSVVPEPATIVFWMFGLLGAALLASKRSHLYSMV